MKSLEGRERDDDDNNGDDEGRKEVRKQGKKEGRKKGKIEVADSSPVGLSVHPPNSSVKSSMHYSFSWLIQPPGDPTEASIGTTLRASLSGTFLQTLP